MRVGQPVEVYSTFEQVWIDGFVIADKRPDGYRLRRLSDGAVLPSPAAPQDLRAVGHHHAPV